MNLLALRNVNLVALLASPLTLCSGASAEVPRAQKLDEFGALGYVSMDRLNATLLYTAMTGEPYNPKLVVYKSWADFPRAYDAKRTELISGDEFASKDALKVFQPIMDSRIDKIKQAKGYVVPLTVEVGEYDFKAQRFPIRIEMSHDDSDSNKTYTCGWEFKFGEGKTNRGQDKKLGACLTAKNWAKDNPAFKYLPISEADARKIKNRYKGGALAFYFLMERTGNFQIVRDPNFHYAHQPNGRELRDGFPGGVVNVVGLQEANVLQFIIADKAGGEIYLVMPMPDAPVNNTRARNERAAIATETAPGTTISAAEPSTTIDGSSPRYIPGPPLTVASSAGTESNSSTPPRSDDRTPVAPQNAPPVPPRKPPAFSAQESLFLGKGSSGESVSVSLLDTKGTTRKVQVRLSYAAAKTIASVPNIMASESTELIDCQKRTYSVFQYALFNSLAQGATPGWTKDIDPVDVQAVTVDVNSETARTLVFRAVCIRSSSTSNTTAGAQPPTAIASQNPVSGTPLPSPVTASLPIPAGTPILPVVPETSVGLVKAI